MVQNVLSLRTVTKKFSSIIAVDRVSFDVTEGETLAIIGPNGAGKTTLFNLLTGGHTPTSGNISLYGEEINGKEPEEIVQQGLVRSFQITQLFPSLTVLENVRLATQRQTTGFSFSDFFSHYTVNEEAIENAHSILERLGLTNIAYQPAADLSHGQQRHLEIGMALACKPKVLCMDEPTAGMSPAETHEIRSLIQDLAQDLTVLIVEHDMDVVMDVSDRIAVMNQGTLLAIDRPTAIRDNQDVQEVYLSGGMA